MIAFPFDENRFPDGWFYLATAQHTGTHYARLLLELHPNVSFWKCGVTVSNTEPMHNWFEAYHQARNIGSGATNWKLLTHAATRPVAQDPTWTINTLREAGVEMEPKETPQLSLVQCHVGRLFYWFDQVPTVVTMRDPLLAVLSGLRRDGIRRAHQIIAGIRFLILNVRRCRAGPELADPLVLHVGDKGHVRTLAADRLQEFGIVPTQQQKAFLAGHHRPNTTEQSEERNPNATAFAKYTEARRHYVTEGKIAGVLKPWIRSLTEPNDITSFLIDEGYNLPWLDIS